MARSLRNTAIAFGCLVLILGLAALAGILWLRGDSGRAWLVAQIQQAVRGETGLELTLENLEGDLFNTVVAHQVAIADRDGRWLTMARARIEWLPWDLVEGRLHIASLNALALEITRAPTLEKASSGPSKGDPSASGGPSLPIDILLDHLSVQPVVLGEALLGEALTLEVEGRLAAREGDLLEADLTAVRHDEPGGALEASATYRLSDQQLGARLTLTEPSGASMRRLSGLDQAGATTVKLESGGSLSDLEGKLELQVVGLGTADGAFSLALGDEPRLAVSGQARSDWMPPGMPPELWDGDLRFAFDAGLSQGRKLALDSLALENRIAAVQAKGMFDTEQGTIAATADIDIRDQAVLGTVIAPWRITSPELSLALDGTLERPQLEINAAVAELAGPRLESGSTRLSLTLGPAPGTGLRDLELAFSGSGQVSGLTVEGLTELAPLLGPELTWQADGSVDLVRESLSLAQGRIVGDRITVTALGEADFTPGLSLDATVDLSDLGPLGSLVGITPSGRLQLEAKLRSDDLSRGVDAALTGQLSDLTLGEATLDQLLGPRPGFEADVTLEDYARVGLSALNAELRTGRLTGDLDIDLAKAELAGDLEFVAPELSVFTSLVGETLSGAGRLEAAVSGALADPAAKGRLRLSEFTVGPLVPSALTADFTARSLGSAPKGRVAMELAARQLSLAARSGFELSDRTLRLEGLSLQGDGVAADGILRIPLAGPPVQGELTLKIADLAPSLSLLAVDGAGAGNADLALGRENGRQTLAMTGELQDLRLALSEEAELSVQTARLSAQSPDLFAGGVSDLRLDLENISTGTVTLDSLGITGRGDLEAAQFDLAARGDLQGELMLDAAGTLSLAEGRTEVTVERLDGQLLGETVALSDPARVIYGERVLQADNLRITFGAARLGLDAEVSEAHTEARFEATDVPLALAKIAAPDLEIEGIANLEARLSGPSSRPSGSLSFDARDVNLGEDLDSPPLQITAEGTLDDNRLSLTSRLSGFARDTAVLELALPLRLAVLPFAAEMVPDQPLSGSLKWAGELSELWALVPLDGHRVAGPTSIDVALSGTPLRPRADGRLTISKGDYESFETGTLLRDLVVVLDLRGERLVVETLTANDGGSGTLKGSGAVDLKPDQGFPFGFETDFTGFTLVRRDDVTAASNGTLKVEGSLTEAAVDGSFETTNIQIRIPDTLPPEIVDLEVTELGANRPVPSESDRRASNKGGTKVALNLSITMPARVYVRGRGLETEWKGWLRITGTAADPAVEGELENLRGRLRVVGKDFALEQSKISFAGTSDLAPLLDIRAVHEADDLVVTVTVTGTPDKPTITLTSVPTLPQEEILARVLFGKNTTQLSAFEAIQLAASVAELSGSGLGGKGALDFTRDLIGVDVLNVGASEGAAGGAEVSAGKYITDDVFVGVKQGTTPGSSTVEVEVELTPNISVGSDIDSTGKSDIGVQFKWDY